MYVLLVFEVEVDDKCFFSRKFSSYRCFLPGNKMESTSKSHVKTQLKILQIPLELAEIFIQNL